MFHNMRWPFSASYMVVFIIFDTHILNTNSDFHGINYPINTLRPRLKLDAVLQTTLSKSCSWIKNVWISIKISLKFVAKGLINNIPVLVQIMAWRRPGDKLLPELMMVRSLTHICVTLPQWVKTHNASANDVIYKTRIISMSYTSSAVPRH